MKATKKILEFKRRLDAYCEQGGFVARQYAGSRRTDNVIGVFAKNGDGTVHILYVKDRSDGEGFWGINTNQVDAFERKGYEWSVVLLIGSGERSYLGSSQLVKRGFSEWSSSKSDYKVHEKEIAGLFVRFESYAALFVHFTSTIK